MPGPIVVASCGRASSTGALRIAHRLALRRQIPLHVVGVTESLTVGAPERGSAGDGGNTSESGASEVERNVRRQITEVCRHGDPVVLSIVSGPVAESVAGYARDMSASAVVLGSGSSARGSRADRLARLITTPLLAVPADAVELPRRAVAGVDFSAFSIDAVRTALDYLADNAELHLFHVAWSVPIQPENAVDEWLRTYHEGARVRLAALATELRQTRPLEVTTTVGGGDPADELLHHVERVAADLMVAGSHGYGCAGRVAMGNVSAQLLRRAPCSVLLTPPRVSAHGTGEADVATEPGETGATALSAAAEKTSRF
jgi:nucleotide-binding universal stress UspA family protein